MSSFTYDYYDVEAILREEERVPVVFRCAAHKLGHIDPSCGERDLPAGTRAELPHWVVRSLAQKQMVDVAAPRCFSDRVRAKLNADADSVALGDKCRNFYGLGLDLAAELGDEDLGAVLRRTMAHRFRRILDRALNSRGRDMVRYVNQLSELEKRVYSSARSSEKDL